MKEAYAELMASSASGGTITPAAEWLVDNFYTAELHIHQIIEDLPSGYFRQLPKLAKEHLAGYPRVMAIALGLHRPYRFPLRQGDTGRVHQCLSGGLAAYHRRVVGPSH